MKKKQRTALVAFVMTVAAMLAACSSSMTDSDSSVTTSVTTVQMRRTTAFATVQGVNRTAGLLTLQWSNGSVNTYRAGPNVANLSLLQVGEVVKASVAESLAVYIGPDAANPNVSGGTHVRLVPSGDTSALVLAHTYVISERIVGLDPDNRTVTVQPPASPPQTLTLTPNLDISKLRVGEMVVMRVSEAIAMVVEQQ